MSSIDFRSRRLTPLGVKHADEIRDAYAALVSVLDRNLKDSRELSLALTAIQESAMWAIKASALAPERSVK